MCVLSLPNIEGAVMSHSLSKCDEVSLRFLGNFSRDLCNKQVSSKSFDYHYSRNRAGWVLTLTIVYVYVTCYHKMSVKSLVCIQRYSLLNMSQNNRKTKENQHKMLTFAGQNRELCPHITYHFRACIMKNSNL